jgi:GNAT superfamily N-acetyltransferase
LKIRVATIADVPSVARVFVESWKNAYEGLMPEPFLKGMTYETSVKIFTESLQTKKHAYSLHVAETPEGRIVGFADCGLERSNPEKGIGELYGLYILKEFQRQGIGEKLFQVVLQNLAQGGMKSMVLWVLDRSPYRKFYVKTGGKLQDGIKQLAISGQAIRLVSYGWSL